MHQAGDIKLMLLLSKSAPPVSSSISPLLGGPRPHCSPRIQCMFTLDFRVSLGCPCPHPSCLVLRQRNESRGNTDSSQLPGQGFISCWDQRGLLMPFSPSSPRESSSTPTFLSDPDPTEQKPRNQEHPESKNSQLPRAQQCQAQLQGQVSYGPLCKTHPAPSARSAGRSLGQSSGNCGFLTVPL